MGGQDGPRKAEHKTVVTITIQKTQNNLHLIIVKKYEKKAGEYERLRYNIFL